MTAFVIVLGALVVLFLVFKFAQAQSYREDQKMKPVADIRKYKTSTPVDEPAKIWDDTDARRIDAGK